MGRIDLIISHEHFLEVDELLRRYNVDGMTFYSVRGRGRSKQEEVSSRNEIVRSVPEFVTGTNIEVTVEDSIAKPFIEDIRDIYLTVYSLSEKYLYLMLQKLIRLIWVKLVAQLNKNRLTNVKVMYSL